MTFWGANTQSYNYNIQANFTLLIVIPCMVHEI